MPKCDTFHKEYDRLANGPVQVGELPAWSHVKGKVAWYVYRGSYAGLGQAWQKFAQKRTAAKLAGYGAPGDLYVCDPADHPVDREAKLLTILWAPLKA